MDCCSCVLFALAEQQIGEVAGDPLQLYKECTLALRHMIMEIKTVRRIDDERNTSKPGGHAANQRCDRCMDMEHIKGLLTKKLRQLNY